MQHFACNEECLLAMNTGISQVCEILSATLLFFRMLPSPHHFFVFFGFGLGLSKGKTFDMTRYLSEENTWHLLAKQSISPLISNFDIPRIFLGLFQA
jgi:hypothetical protein